MKVIIAGSRALNDPALVAAAVAASRFEITSVVGGRASGIDALGEQWAKDHAIPFFPFPADWATYGKAAGPKRNEHMAKFADALIAIPHPTEESFGTRDMIRRAHRHGLMVMIYDHNCKIGGAQ